MERATLTRVEAASYLGISEWLLWRLTKEGLIPHFRAGNRLLFRKESLDNWMLEQEKNHQDISTKLQPF